jgi:hypothetical protein
MSFLAPLATVFGGASASGGIGLGSLLSAGSSVLGTISAVGAARYQAGVARNNAEIAKQNAQRASDQAQQEQVQQDQQTLALIGEQEAIQGASGLSISGASQLRTRRTAQRLGRQDALNIRQQGDNEIRNLLQESENFKAEARAQSSAATGALIGGIFDVGSSLVGGSTSVRDPSRVTGTRTRTTSTRNRIAYDYRRSLL